MRRAVHPSYPSRQQALWLKECEPDTWAAAATVCECQDWLQFKLTGALVAGGCNVATRWHCDGAAAVADDADADPDAPFGGRPVELLKRVGLEAVALGEIRSEGFVRRDSFGEIRSERVRRLGGRWVGRV